MCFKKALKLQLRDIAQYRQRFRLYTVYAVETTPFQHGFHFWKVRKCQTERVGRMHERHHLIFCETRAEISIEGIIQSQSCQRNGITFFCFSLPSLIITNEILQFNLKIFRPGLYITFP